MEKPAVHYHEVDVVCDTTAWIVKSALTSFEGRIVLDLVILFSRPPAASALINKSNNKERIDLLPWYPEKASLAHMKSVIALIWLLLVYAVHAFLVREHCNC